MPSCELCSADLQDGARFCSSCGAPVGGAGQGPLGGGFSRLALSTDVRGRLLTDIEGEHRLVTVVFADLTSFVKRTRDLHPEEAMQLVNRLLEAMVETLLRYGGRVDRFLGDGLLAVFGIPETHEDDPERAVRAALDIRERAEELELGVAVGINTGRVYFGPVGSSLHEELTVMGPVVNLAARLQTEAKEGQVLIGLSTRSHVYAAFDLHPLTVKVKGIEEPIQAYLAERLLDHPDKVRGVEGLQAELVGRDRELDRLESACELAGGRFVTLVGEAGVGKSRLAAEFHHRFVKRGGVWLEGRGLELTRHVGYGPIRDMLRRSVGNPDTAVETLRRSIRELTTAGRLSQDWLEEVGPFLVALVAEEGLEDPRVVRAAPQQRKSITATAISDYLEALVGDRPTVVFLDDLHWSDELTIDLLARLIPRLDSSPVTLLGSYRPDPGSPGQELLKRAMAASPESFETLLLRELSESDSRQMIRSLLAVDRLPGSLEEFVLARAEGNPFYLEELVRSLIQNGVIFRNGVGWRASGEISELGVPDSVQALVMSRVDRLDRQVRRCAQIASVLGRRFIRPLVESIAKRDVEKDLDILTDAGIVYAERLVPVEEYTFVHALSQEAVYETLLPSRRAELHEAAAEIMERLFPAEIEALAYHYERSRNHAKAVEYLLAAGERAMEAFVTGAALGYLDRGSERVGCMHRDEDRRQWESRFRARRGEMLERLARHEEARAELKCALELAAHGPSEEAGLHRLLGQTHRLQGQFEKAHASYDEAERVLDASLERDSTSHRRAWIEIQKERAFALYFGGREYELPEHNARTAQVVEEHGSAVQRVDHLIGRLLSDFRRHRFAVPPGVVSDARRALELASEAADVGRIAELRFALGFALLWADECDGAEEMLLKALRDADRIGDVMLENRALSYYATCLRRLDRPSDTRRVSQLAWEAARELKDGYYQGHALANLCWTNWRDGSFAEARRLGVGAYAAWGKKEDHRGKGLGTEFAFLAVWPLAAMALEAGDVAEALDHLRHLASPWERTVPSDLREAIDEAWSGAGGLDTVTWAVQLARHYRLL